MNKIERVPGGLVMRRPSIESTKGGLIMHRPSAAEEARRRRSERLTDPGFPHAVVNPGGSTTPIATTTRRSPR